MKTQSRSNNNDPINEMLLLPRDDVVGPVEWRRQEDTTTVVH